MLLITFKKIARRNFLREILVGDSLYVSDAVQSSRQFS